MKNTMDSPMLFIVLSFLYPTVYLLKINSDVYTADQIVVTLIFVLLVSVITALAGGFFVSVFVKAALLIAKQTGLKTETISISSKIYRVLLGVGGTIILLVLLHPAIRGLFPAVIHNRLWIVLAYLLVLLGVCILMFRIEFTMFNLILCVLIAINGASVIYQGIMDESLIPDTQKIQQKVVFKQKPNVYLIVLESYASLAIRKEIYGINNEALTQKLKINNYDLYKCYSNYAFTLASVSSIFLMDHHYYKPTRGIFDGEAYRKIIGGVVDNPVINIFLNNGYRIDYSDFASSLYHRSSVVRLPLLEPIEVFGGIFTFARRVLHCDLRSLTFFQSLLWLPERIAGKLPDPVKKDKTAKDGRPVFSVVYAGAYHSPMDHSEYPPEISDLPGAARMPFWKLNHLKNYWVATYKKMVVKADAALIKLVGDLAEKDPDAVVILVGDHGTYFNRDRWTGEKNDLNENMLGNGMQPAEVTRDLFEVFMAIKWPSGTEKPHGYFSHVNVFRQVFAVLTKDHTILKTRVLDNSYLFADKEPSYSTNIPIYCTVKDGKLLNRWEPFVIPVARRVVFP